MILTISFTFTSNVAIFPSYVTQDWLPFFLYVISTCSNIINFNLFTSPEYQSHFQILEKDRQELLTDKFSIYFFELKKVKKSQKGKPVEDWLNLINAEKKEELMALELSTNIPEVKDVIVKVRELSSDEKLRRLAYYREKRLHDEANAINGSKKEGIKIGRAEGRAEGRVEGRVEREKELIAMMRQQGYSEEQINKLFGAIK